MKGLTLRRSQNLEFRVISPEVILHIGYKYFFYAVMSGIDHRDPFLKRVKSGVVIDISRHHNIRARLRRKVNFVLSGTGQNGCSDDRI